MFVGLALGNGRGQGRGGGRFLAGTRDRGLAVVRGGIRSRSSTNCSVTCVVPCELDEFIVSSPAIVENSFSSGVATEAAIVSGDAPGSAAVTCSVGKSTFGRSLTGSC